MKYAVTEIKFDYNSLDSLSIVSVHNTQEEASLFIENIHKQRKSEIESRNNLIYQKSKELQENADSNLYEKIKIEYGKYVDWHNHHSALYQGATGCFDGLKNLEDYSENYIKDLVTKDIPKLPYNEDYKFYTEFRVVEASIL